MRIERVTFEVQYRAFDVGEIVSPVSFACTLKPGDYRVTRFIPPCFPGDEATIFVEGHPYGLSARWFLPAGSAARDTET
jgi:hypothetical protein